MAFIKTEKRPGPDFITTIFKEKYERPINKHSK